MESFHFTNIKEKQIEDRRLLVMKAMNIPRIYGSCEDELGNNRVIKDYKGIVSMDIENVGDITLTTNGSTIFYNEIKVKGGKKIYPKKGFYHELLKSQLILDIDLLGKVWLTRTPFNIEFLRNKQNELRDKLLNLKKQLEDLEETLDAAEHWDEYRWMAAESEGEESKKSDLFYRSIQEEMNTDEYNRMNLETDGFWSIEDQ